jgi:hypothetical protein
MMDRHKCDRAKTTIDTAHNLMHLACQPLVCKPPTCPCDETNTPTYYITKSCAQIVIEENKLYLISLKVQYDVFPAELDQEPTLRNICASWHSNLHEQDFLPPLWVLFQEHLKGQQLLRDPFDHVKPVNPQHDLLTAKA